MVFRKISNSTFLSITWYFVLAVLHTSLPFLLFYSLPLSQSEFSSISFICFIDYSYYALTLALPCHFSLSVLSLPGFTNLYFFSFSLPPHPHPLSPSLHPPSKSLLPPSPSQTSFRRGGGGKARKRGGRRGQRVEGGGGEEGEGRGWGVDCKREGERGRLERKENRETKKYVCVE